VVTNQPRQRLKAIKYPNWVQFFPYCPLRFDRELCDLEARNPRKRAWNVVGAGTVYLRTITTFWGIGRTIYEEHRWRHRRHVRDHWDKSCVARDLYMYILRVRARDLDQRIMPIRPIVVPSIERALDYRIRKPRSFHREVVRDLQQLPMVTAKPKAERLKAEHRLVLRYWATAGTLALGQHPALSRDNLNASTN
jgi:hypothetical protein